jgi:hypothetical protein
VSRLHLSLLSAVPLLSIMGFLGLAEGLGTIGRSVYYGLGGLLFLGMISGAFRQFREQKDDAPEDASGWPGDTKS